MSDTRARLVTIVTEILSVDAGQVVDNATFESDLGADSLDMVELTMAFEDAFMVEITDDEAEPLRTIGDALELLRAKLREVAA